MSGQSWTFSSAPGKERQKSSIENKSTNNRKKRGECPDDAGASWTSRDGRRLKKSTGVTDKAAAWEVLDGWIKSKTGAVAPSTLKASRQAVKFFVEFLGARADRSIKSLTRADV